MNDYGTPVRIEMSGRNPIAIFTCECGKVTHKYFRKTTFQPYCSTCIRRANKEWKGYGKILEQCGSGF